MDKKDWTPEELELKEALNKLYETDTRKPPKPLDLSFMEEPAKKKSARRRRRLAYVAAAVLLVFASSFATAVFISNDYASAVQEKFQRKVFEMKHGVVVATDEEFAEEGETVWEITDFEVAKKAKELVPELPIPGYMPEGYEFEKLSIHLLNNGEFSASYTYKNKKNYLYLNSNSMENRDLLSTTFSGKSLTIDEKKVMQWSDSTTSSKGLTVISNNCLLQITLSDFNLADDELLCIVKNLDF